MDTIIASLLVLVAQAETAPAAPPAVSAQASPRTIDLRAQLERRKWKAGRDVFYKDANIELVAEVRGGKVVSVTPIKLNRNVVAVSARKPRGSRPCIICYRLDQPLASTCIEVPCWMVPILKPILDRL